MIRHIWIEQESVSDFDTKHESTDVIVETDDGAVWSASFVTIPFLQRQMQMSREVASDIDNMPPVRFVAIETPHVIVDSLDQDTIEDTIDNMMTLGVFESVFEMHSAAAPDPTPEDEAAGIAEMQKAITANEPEISG